MYKTRTSLPSHTRESLIQRLTAIANDVLGAHGVRPDDRLLHLLVDMGLISAGQDPEYMQQRR